MYRILHIGYNANIKKMIFGGNIMKKEKIKMEYQQMLNQEGVFTPSHKRYEIKISYNEKSFVFEYQSPGLPKKEEVLESLIGDMDAYEGTLDIDSFQEEFGYKKVSECEKAYNGCKEISKKMHSIFSMYELDQLAQMLF